MQSRFFYLNIYYRYPFLLSQVVFMLKNQHKKYEAKIAIYRNCPFISRWLFSGKNSLFYFELWKFI